MRVRLKDNTIWGPAGAVIVRADKAFEKWVKKNAALVTVLDRPAPPKVQRTEPKPKKIEPQRAEPPKAEELKRVEKPKDYKGVKNA